jgi:hypothetical protein
MDLRFEWDAEKAFRNVSKHGVNFEEARTVFDDPLSVTVVDYQHSQEEDRYVDIGLSSSGQLLVVVYTERGGVVRLISSRKATSAERRTYEQGGF